MLWSEAGSKRGPAASEDRLKKAGTANNEALIRVLRVIKMDVLVDDNGRCMDHGAARTGSDLVGHRERTVNGAPVI